MLLLLLAVSCFLILSSLPACFLARFTLTLDLLNRLTFVIFFFSGMYLRISRRFLCLRHCFFSIIFISLSQYRTLEDFKLACHWIECLLIRYTCSTLHRSLLLDWLYWEYWTLGVFFATSNFLCNCLYDFAASFRGGLFRLNCFYVLSIPLQFRSLAYVVA